MDNRVFKAMVVRETDDKKFVREIVTRNINELPPSEVLIKVSYSSLNYKDALSASGHRGVTRKYPHTPGIDAAGIVAESTSALFRSGEAVIVTGFDLGMNTSGGFAEFIRVPASWPVKLPKSLTLKESMAFGTAGFTAALSLLRLEQHGLSADQGPILVTGATGGVGSTAVAILARAGYQVIAATGKAEAKEYLVELGASGVISRDDINDTSGKPLLKEQWAGVIDTVGGNILATALKSTCYAGSVAACGLVASPDLPTTVYPFILRGVNLLGIESSVLIRLADKSGMGRSAAGREASAAAWNQALRLVSDPAALQKSKLSANRISMESSMCPSETRHIIWEKLSGPWKPNNLAAIGSECSLEQLGANIETILHGKMKGRMVVVINGE